PAVDLLGDLLVEVLGRLLGPAALGTLANAGGAELLGEHPQHVGLRLPENSRRMLGVIGVVVGPELDALGIAQQHAEGVPGRIDHRGELTRRRGHGHTDLVDRFRAGRLGLGLRAGSQGEEPGTGQQGPTRHGPTRQGPVRGHGCGARASVAASCSARARMPSCSWGSVATSWITQAIATAASAISRYPSGESACSANSRVCSAPPAPVMPTKGCREGTRWETLPMSVEAVIAPSDPRRGRPSTVIASFQA